MRRIRIVRSYLVASWPVEAVAIGASSRVEYCGLCLTVGGTRGVTPAALGRVNRGCSFARFPVSLDVGLLC